jgi:hypothetical protein
VHVLFIHQSKLTFRPLSTIVWVPLKFCTYHSTAKKPFFVKVIDIVDNKSVKSPPFIGTLNYHFFGFCHVVCSRKLCDKVLNLSPIGINETPALFVQYLFNSPKNRPSNTLYLGNLKTGNDKKVNALFTSRIKPQPTFVHKSPRLSNTTNIAWIALGYHTDCPAPEIITVSLELSHPPKAPPGNVCRFYSRTEKFHEEHICPVSNPCRSNHKPELKFQLAVTREHRGHIDATIKPISKNQNNR